MFRTDRHLNKKKNGQHNFYGEEDALEIKNGTVKIASMDDDSPPESHPVPSEEKNSG